MARARPQSKFLGVACAATSAQQGSSKERPCCSGALPASGLPEALATEKRAGIELTNPGTESVPKHETVLLRALAEHCVQETLRKRTRKEDKQLLS